MTEIVHTVAVCILAGAMLGWLCFWLHRHGPDKEG
jgi:hypothetical protein